jgi:hypothetical protein
MEGVGAALAAAQQSRRRRASKFGFLEEGLDGGPVEGGV